MADAVTGVVRVIHILTGVMWVGGALIWGMVIAPRVLRDGPPAMRRPFAETVVPAISRYQMIVASLAILSGLVLVGMVWGWGDYFGAFQAGTYGAALGIGAVAAIAMAIVGFGIIAPTAKKLVAAMQAASAPPTPEQAANLGAIGKKIGMMSGMVLLLGTITAIAMAVAVNTIR